MSAILPDQAELKIAAAPLSVVSKGVLRASWALIGLGSAALGWVLIGVWASQPEMNDRPLILLASGWVVYRLQRCWNSVASRPTAFGLLPVAVGAAAYPLAWFLLVQVGPRVILLWWLLAALVAGSLGLSAVQNGWARTRLLIFPLLFTFFALPAPDLVMAPLQRVLQEGTTTAASFALSSIGIAVDRHGYVLSLPGGDLGIVEACSGVRSVSALTAIAVFVAYVRGFTLLRGCVLVGLSFGIIVISNAVRVITTGLLQENIGRWTIEGTFHEMLGVMVVLVGLALIVGTSSLLARRGPKRETSLHNEQAASGDDSGERRQLSLPRNSYLGLAADSIAFTMLLAAALASGWAEQFRQTHREEVDLEQLPFAIGGWTSTSNERIDPGVTEMLKCDQILLRTYSDAFGREVQVYVMFWATPASTAHMHHPDICWSRKGWNVTSGEVRTIPLANCPAPLPVSSRLYTRATARQLIYYWTQHGNEILPDGAETPGSLGSEYAWIGALLSDRAPISRQARLSVLVGTDVHGPVEALEQKLQAFTGALAGEVYRLCPWAVPAAKKSELADPDGL